MTFNGLWLAQNDPSYNAHSAEKAIMTKICNTRTFYSSIDIDVDSYRARLTWQYKEIVNNTNM